MLGVLRRNPEFRRLWLAQVASELGDWLNRVALLTLIGRLSGDGESVDVAAGIGFFFGLEFATRMLPGALIGPLAGPVADRLSRKFLMIAADVVRCAIVLAFLLIDEPGELPLAYALLAAQMSVAVFFQSARSAAVPNTVHPDDLHDAYTLTSATWSTMLSVGALTGGLFVSSLGIDGVFVLDAFTYLVSAMLLSRANVGAVPVHPERFRWRDVFLFTELRRAFAHVRSRALVPSVFAKAFWGGAGGYLVLLSVAAHVRFSNADPAWLRWLPLAGLAEGEDAIGRSVGLLYFARGIGTGIGPVLARYFTGSSTRALLRQVAFGFLVGAAGYVGFAYSHDLTTAIAWVVFAHLGGSALWVGSTLLWQRGVDDAFRGRVYALEAVGQTLAFSAGALVTGLYFDATGDVTATTLAVCAAVVVLGGTWTALERRSVRIGST